MIAEKTTKPKKTPEELLAHKQRVFLQSLCNRIASDFSFKRVKTWADVYKFSVNPVKEHPPSQVVLYPELKQFFNKLHEEFEFRIAKRLSRTPQSEVPVTSDIQDRQVADININTRVSTEIHTPSTSNELPEPTKQLETTDESGFNNNNDYGLHPSDKEKAFLFWFQKKAVKELWDGIIRDKKRAQLLLASTGTGKTFMCGALLRRLIDINFSESRTYGHIPYLYVTRATIVEQTKRVFTQHFNIGIKDGVEVVNIEQLRSRAGQVWIKEEVYVEQGEEHVKYIWKNMIQPCVFILDECQSVKNEGTTQSDIVQAYADNPSSETYCVFVSATPFTKVIEAKSFVLNTHLDDKEFMI